MEAKVIISFFNIVDRAYSHVSEGRDSWKNYSTDRLDTQWKQMLFLCCFYDVGYYAKEMTTRNWSRICRKMLADEKHGTSNNILDSEVPRGGIYELLVPWSGYPALFRDMIKFMKEINAEKPTYWQSSAVPSKSKLEAHMRKHTGEKPYKCHLCDYSATQSGTLDRHIRAHKGEELFQCEYCGKSFISNGTLIYHLASMHHAKGNFNYRCYSCHFQYDNVVAGQLASAVNAVRDATTRIPQ